MAEHPGVARARDCVDHFHKGDPDVVQDYYADDIVWHVAGNHDLSRDYRRRDALLEYFGKVRDLTGGTLRLEPESILASNRHIAMFIRVTGQKDGKELNVLQAQVLKVAPDGRWAEFWSLADDQDAVDSFWS
jgi:ketosteroid isomerase-like protein